MKLLVTPATGKRMNCGSCFLIKAHGDKRRLAICDRYADAEYLATCADDRELKKLRKFYREFLEWDESEYAIWTLDKDKDFDEAINELSDFYGAEVNKRK